MARRFQQSQAMDRFEKQLADVKKLSTKKEKEDKVKSLGKEFKNWLDDEERNIKKEVASLRINAFKDRIENYKSTKTTAVKSEKTSTAKTEKS